MTYKTNIRVVRDHVIRCFSICPSYEKFDEETVKL